MLSTTPTVPTAEFEARTGWSFMPEGACKGEVCIPLASPPGDTVDLAEIAAAMQLPLVHDEAHGVWAVGPESIGDKTLTTAEPVAGSSSSVSPSTRRSSMPTTGWPNCSVWSTFRTACGSTKPG